MKSCSQCGTPKPVTDYYTNGRQPCKECHKVNVRAYRVANRDELLAKARERRKTPKARAAELAWKDANREALRTKTRERDLLRAYGISASDYEQMNLEQGDLCAICGLGETSIHHRSGQPRALAVDHNHQTGKVRGLLCNRCNQAIGLLEDDADLLIAAAVYLGLHATSPEREIA